MGMIVRNVYVIDDAKNIIVIHNDSKSLYYQKLPAPIERIGLGRSRFRRKKLISTYVHLFHEKKLTLILSIYDAAIPIIISVARLMFFCLCLLLYRSRKNDSTTMAVSIIF